MGFIDLEQTTADRHREYLERPFQITCSNCGKTITETQAVMEAAGWTLNRRGEWCPQDKPGAFTFDVAKVIGEWAEMNR